MSRIIHQRRLLSALVRKGRIVPPQARSYSSSTIVQHPQPPRYNRHLHMEHHERRRRSNIFAGVLFTVVVVASGGISAIVMAYCEGEDTNPMEKEQLELNASDESESQWFIFWIALFDDPSSWDILRVSLTSNIPTVNMLFFNCYFLYLHKIIFIAVVLSG